MCWSWLWKWLIRLPGLLSVYWEPSRRTKQARQDFYASVERDIVNNLNWLTVKLDSSLDIETLTTGPYAPFNMVVGRGDRQVLRRKGMTTHPGTITGIRLWSGDKYTDTMFTFNKSVNSCDTLECDIDMDFNNTVPLGKLGITFHVE